jgi:hypothetical protein
MGISYLIDMIMAQAELENWPIITYDIAFHTGLIQVIPTIESRA